VRSASNNIHPYLPLAVTMELNTFKKQFREAANKNK
jgi:hypothetical protein